MLFVGAEAISCFVDRWQSSRYLLGLVLLGSCFRSGLAFMDLLVPPEVRDDREVLTTPFNFTSVGCPLR